MKKTYFETVTKRKYFEKRWYLDQDDISKELIARMSKSSATN